MTSPLNAWNTDPDPETLAYHKRQWDRVYGSTVKFCDFLDDRIKAAGLVLDAGCGGGANTNYMALRYSDTRFTGFDVSAPLVELAMHKASRPLPLNLTYQQADLTMLGPWFGVDGVILLQVLSWMPGYEKPLGQIMNRIHPKWIAFSTLLYEGDIDCQVVVTEHQRPRTSYNNVYGLPKLTRFMRSQAYSLARCIPFTIDVDLPKPDNFNLMKTYTTKDRLQVSGPLLLPWHFCCFERGS